MNAPDLTTRAVNFIRFHGLTLLVAEHGGIEYVPLKPLADLAGIDWRTTKNAMLEGDSVGLFGTLRLKPPVIDAAVEDSPPSKTVVYIRLDRARMYLARINTNRMRSQGNVAAADQLLALQIEWAEALHKYETHGVAVKSGRQHALRDLLGLLKARALARSDAERNGLAQLVTEEMRALGVDVAEVPKAQGELPLAAGAAGAAGAAAWTDQQCIEFMAVALRHVEYAEGNDGPSCEDIRLGVARALALTDASAYLRSAQMQG